MRLPRPSQLIPSRHGTLLEGAGLPGSAGSCSSLWPHHAHPHPGESNHCSPARRHQGLAQGTNEDVGLGGQDVGLNTFLVPCCSQFGIVLDAGSSHTSLLVYQWPANKEKDTGVVSQALTCQTEGQWTVLGQAIAAWLGLPGDSSVRDHLVTLGVLGKAHQPKTKGLRVLK